MLLLLFHCLLRRCSQTIKTNHIDHMQQTKNKEKRIFEDFLCSDCFTRDKKESNQNKAKRYNDFKFYACFLFKQKKKKIFEFSYTPNQNSESTDCNEYKSEYGQSYELWIMFFPNVDVIQICNHGTFARDGGHQHIWIIWLLHFISLQTQRCGSSKSF